MMRKILKALFSVALAAATFGLPAPGAAGADSPVTVQAEAGYGGVVPQGGWAPIQVSVTNHGPDTKATLKLGTGQSGQSGGGTIKGPVVLPSTGSVGAGGWYGFSGPASGSPAVTQELDVVLPAGTMKHFTAYLPSSPGTWTAEVVGPSGRVLAASRTQVLQSTSLSVAVVSDDPHALDQIGSIQDVAQTFQGPPQAIHLTPGALPDNAAALSSFGLVVVTNATTDSLTAAQRRALDDYAAQGGSILATGGDAWRKTQAGLPADNGIVVDKSGRVDGRDDVFAAGDVANYPNLVLGGQFRVEHEDHANTHGRFVGANMSVMHGELWRTRYKDVMSAAETTQKQETCSSSGREPDDAGNPEPVGVQFQAGPDGNAHQPAKTGRGHDEEDQRGDAAPKAQVEQKKDCDGHNQM